MLWRWCSTNGFTAGLLTDGCDTPIVGGPPSRLDPRQPGDFKGRSPLPSGYDGTTQPYPVWTPTSGTSLTFAPIKPGHSTVHVRAALTNNTTGAIRRAAYEGNLTYLLP